MELKNLVIGVLAALVFAPGVVKAAELMPTFADVPTGWSVDRYAPDSFANVGTFAGKTNVLGIGIGANGAFENRAPAFQSQFYDTQGMGNSINGGAGDSLSASLYVPSSWLTPANGLVRTDMWGVMNNGTLNNVTNYPIIGFTNDGASGYVGFQVWDDNLNGGAGGWAELATGINTNAWNDLSIDFTGTAFDYYINGVEVYVEASGNGSTNFQEVIMQAYNFNDTTNFPGVNSAPYTADWANVPEPATLALLGSGVLGLVAARRRQKSSR